MSAERDGAPNLGESAFLVLDDADIAAAVAMAAFSAPAGQGCAMRSAQQPNAQNEAIAQLSRTARRRRISWHARASTRSSCEAWVLGVRGGR
ncbi:hypothetical protein [Nocardia brasiliensis]